MVRKKDAFYTIADWRKDNPVEADILDLINAANSYAMSLVPHIDDEIDDPYYTPARVDNALTELELTIQRGEQAIRLLMGVPQARKAAGLAKRGRGKDKSYDPESTKLSDPQVQVVLEMLRGEKTQEMAFSEVAKIISPNEKIDQRTINRYVDEVIENWGRYAELDRKPLWVGKSDA
jgi:hypothetical protein